MNKYKIIFEKSYADRCVTKKITKEIVIESALDFKHQRNELNNFAFSVLASTHPDFINNINERFLNGWSQPQIKDFKLIDKNIL
ncbi:MAG: hypothetical protein F9K45_08545 [Melioribacteraceae bacterium]|nr:MAG: hypothetical protein F9K45_08545 [Melioribacteraceae bacterium]